MIIGEIGQSSYDSSDIKSFLQVWPVIMSSWDDNKSHKIDSTYYSNIRSLCDFLFNLAQHTQDELNNIKNQLDSI